MIGLVRGYRVLAYVVGVMLAIGALVVLPCQYLLTEGSSLQRFGERASTPVFLIHGYVYLVYFAVTLVLWIRARWTIRFAILVLVAGLIPLLIFWVERWVMRRLAEDNPEMLGMAHSEA